MDITDTQPTARCVACVPGYALKDDNSTCTSKYSRPHPQKCMCPSPLRRSVYLLAGLVAAAG